MITSTLFALALSAAAVTQAKTELMKTHGEAQRPRIVRGVDQAASLWRASDGDGDAFVAFAKENFTSDPKTLDAVFSRFEQNLESLDGHFVEIGARRLRADGHRTGPDPPDGPPLRGLRPGRARHRGPLPAQGRLRRAAELPAHHARRSASRRAATGAARQWAEVRLAQPLRPARPGRRCSRGSPRPAPTPSSTSPSTTSGCTTSSDGAGRRGSSRRG